MDCPECEEKIECECMTSGMPPCSQCTEHVCYAIADEGKLCVIEDKIEEAQDADIGHLNSGKMLKDLEWLSNKLRDIYDQR